MKTFQRMIFAAVAAFISVASVAISPERPPATMSFDANSAPFWISAAAATAPDGTLSHEIFPPGVREVVQAHSFPARATASSGKAEPCKQMVIVNTDEPLVSGTSAAEKKVGDGVLSGTVTAVTEGFLDSAPASVLTVHVDEVLRDAAGVSALTDVFVPYYAADFTIDDMRFCNTGLPRNGVSYMPQTGDRILVRFSGNLVGHYINARDRHLFLAHGDQVYPPRRLPGGFPDASSFSDLVRRVKAELATGEVSK